MFIFWWAGFHLGFRLACDLHKYVFSSLHVKTYTKCSILLMVLLCFNASFVPGDRV